ncbi:hypothetical protein ABZU75_41300 [Streptosporangium sp. NPDC005286]|uniref:hypothetical protein n=1 Tax=Streptosporangium sp. NPDC005286 TaxID=3154463 RepID=UPI0033A22ECC
MGLAEGTSTLAAAQIRKTATGTVGLLMGVWVIDWVPSYLLEERGISLINTGVMSAIPGLVACATVFLGGWLFDRFFHDRARLYVIPPAPASSDPA